VWTVDGTRPLPRIFWYEDTGMRSTARKGFTLIELLIVVVIIGILAAVAIPKFSNTKEKAAKSAGIADLRNLATAQESFFADSNRYGSIADTALMRFSFSRGNTNPSIVGTATNWSAAITIPGGKICGIRVGPGAPAPTGLATAAQDGQAVCDP
jgi:prepilin-type N-terminal cleavage/methylation domain-containing protein